MTVGNQNARKLELYDPPRIRRSLYANHTKLHQPLTMTFTVAINVEHQQDMSCCNSREVLHGRQK